MSAGDEAVRHHRSVMADVSARRALLAARHGVALLPLYVDESDRLEEAEKEAGESQAHLDEVTEAGRLTLNHLLMAAYGGALVEAMRGNRAETRRALVHLGAVAVAMVEALDAGAPLVRPAAGPLVGCCGPTGPAPCGKPDCVLCTPFGGG